MKIKIHLMGIIISSLSVYGQDSGGVNPETNAVLEESIVLDKADAVQGNTLLKIERLSTPDEELIKALESKKTSSVPADLTDSPVSPLERKSYFISATVYDHTYTLLTFRSLSGDRGLEGQAWSNITSWDGLGASPTFVQGGTEYTMMILFSAAQVTDDSPPLPTNLPSFIEAGAYYQEGGAQPLTPSEVSFMEALHIHYDLKKIEIKEAHQKKVQEQQEKASAKEEEARKKKTVTLRFWRQEDKPSESTPSE